MYYKTQGNVYSEVTYKFCCTLNVNSMQIQNEKSG